MSKPIAILRTTSRDQWLIIGAFAVIYLVWGSTYLANYLAIGSIPPFFMAGSRFLVAGLLVYSWGSYRGQPTPTPQQWGNGVLLGTLFLGVGTGGVVWAQQYIATSMAALIVAFDPMLIMLLMWWLLGSRPSVRSILGAVISIVGVVMLVGQPQLNSTAMARWGLVAIFTSLLAWAVASIYVSRVVLPASRFRATAVQMIGGGVVLLLFSTSLGEWRRFAWAGVTLTSGLSWLYLVLFGSILAFSCFNYLLVRVSPEKVATSTYVNPVVALLLGWGMNGEEVTSQALLAGAVMLTGVFFINTSR